MEDHLLVTQFATGNLKAYEILYKRYYKTLVVYAKQYVKDLQTAQDITQDVFITIYEKRESVAIHTAFKSYMYTAVRNNCLNYIKKERKMVDVPDALYFLGTEQEDVHTISNVELAAQLHRAIDLLPAQNREIFKLSRQRGLTNEEIAVKLNLTKRTVETHISNALKKLRAQFAVLIILFVKIFTSFYVFFIIPLSYL